MAISSSEALGARARRHRRRSEDSRCENISETIPRFCAAKRPVLSHRVRPHAVALADNEYPASRMQSPPLESASDTDVRFVTRVYRPI